MMAAPTTHNYMLAGLNCAGNVHLILGSNPLAAARCTQSLKAGAVPIIVTPETGVLHYSLQAQIDNGSVRWERKLFDDEDLFRLGRREVRGVADAVFVTFDDEPDSAKAIAELCKANRVPVNVVDAPHLCTFSLLSTHTDGPLQIGITTNGRGCKLASRIRREIAASLPPNLGAACAQLGELRRRIQREDRVTTGTHNDSSSNNNNNSNGNGNGTGDLDDSVDQSAMFNSLVTADDTHTRRMRWLSQICEYWPLKRLASVCEADVEQLLQNCKAETAAKRQHPSSETDPDSNADADADHPAAKRRKTDPPRKQGTVILAGSGPGHPQLLTQATLRAIQTADVVLADKLVPSGVMDLIPRRTMVHIARKFPGNADRAQDELQALALDAAMQGRTVLRLKQGDPFVYGRGGEEVRFFRARGLAARQVVVLPGVTSALSAPLFAGVPPTQRAVADQVLICTGTGRSGCAPEPPEYVPSRTVVFLMALHRIGALVRELTSHTEGEMAAGTETTAKASGDHDPARRRLFPPSTQCAVVERASCPDQRVIRTTLAHVARAIEAEGSRPPGLLVVGRACGFLHERDETSPSAWDVEEGFRGLDDDAFGGDWRGLFGDAPRPASEGQEVLG